MTKNLHAHVSTSSSDCDGPMYREYVSGLNDAELTEHYRANGVNDFHDLNFKARILENHVSFNGFVTVNMTAEGFNTHEPTEEGYRAAEVRWCEDETCDPNAYSQRDVYAEQMNY